MQEEEFRKAEIEYKQRLEKLQQRQKELQERISAVKSKSLDSHISRVQQEVACKTRNLDLKKERSTVLEKQMLQDEAKYLQSAHNERLKLDKQLMLEGLDTTIQNFMQRHLIEKAHLETSDDGYLVIQDIGELPPITEFNLQGICPELYK